MSARARLTAGMLVLVMAGSACIGGRSVGDTSALVVGSLIGKVEARDSSADAWHALDKGVRVPVGALVKVPARGAVVLKRGDVSSVEMVPNGSQAGQMRIENVGSIEVISGDVLVKADEKAPISVASQGVSAVPKPSKAVKAPIFRFDRRVSIRVGVYSGDAAVSALDGTLPIGSLYEGVVAAHELPPAATPLTINPRDPFDRQLLLNVIDLDADLANESRGYEAAYGTRMKRWQEIAKVVPGRDLSFTNPYLANTGSADILIGVVFALLLEQRTHKFPADNWFATLMGLLDQGATWGLLGRLYLGDAGLSVLRQDVALAIALRTGQIAPSKGGAVPSSTPTSSPSSTATPSASPTPTKKPSPSPTPTPTPTPIPTPTQSCGLFGLFCQ